MKKKTERFQVLDSLIDGVFVLDRNLYFDHRGSFSRLLCEDEMMELDLNAAIAQINISKTDEIGTIRGMHYQEGLAAEDKYVICLKGSVFDVAIDTREDSKTYLKWDGVTLSANENKMIYIPKGVAHGFQALEKDCWLLYLHTEKYTPKAEMGLNPLDPKLAIKWPISKFIMSDKDLNRKYI
jgi:dTDP-4-dehydrorhamnose 3,5-epimerase